jgi:3-oxoacyl-[acyl-carrier-protein] synthase-1
MIALEEGWLPAGVHTRDLDPELKSEYLLENREAHVRRVLTNSFGFGGSNCSLVLGTAV